MNRIKKNENNSQCVASVKAVGIRGSADFDTVVRHFVGLGGDVVLMDPDMICGRDHVLSAVMHAERAFANGTNRSKSLLTEIILYAACDRQIGKAMERMRPKDGQDGMVAAVLGIDGDLRLGDIGMERCDRIMDPTPEKALALGLDTRYPDIPCGDMILERIAAVDLMKQ